MRNSLWPIISPWVQIHLTIVSTEIGCLSVRPTIAWALWSLLILTWVLSFLTCLKERCNVAGGTTVSDQASNVEVVGPCGPHTPLSRKAISGPTNSTVFFISPPNFCSTNPSGRVLKWIRLSVHRSQFTRSSVHDRLNCDTPFCLGKLFPDPLIRPSLSPHL